MKHNKRKTSKPKGEVPFEVLFRRWRNKVEADGLLKELRRREYFEKPSAVRKRKKAAAEARQRRITSEFKGLDRQRKY